MLASPLYIQGQGDCKSSRTPTAWDKFAAMIQERGVSAKRTQPDHSRRESMMSSPSQEPRADGKPDAMFSSGTGKPTQEFYFFKHADP